MKKLKCIIFAAIMSLMYCSDWLDVVPDGIPTLEMAFNSRTQARKYLATCYSYMPKNGGSADPTTLGGDDIWTRRTTHLSNHFSITGLDLSDGLQNAANPVLPRWGNMYQALRVCNTFLENIDLVP